MAIVRIINPNSNAAVTAAMSEAVDELRGIDGPELDCVTLECGPLGIESDADVRMVEPMLGEFVAADGEAGAFVIACYSDPGLSRCRQATPRPVFGIQECAARAAVSRRAPFGVISILDGAIARHWRRLEELGLAAHCAGDRALGMSVAETEAGGADTFARMLAVGQELCSADGARSLILGCAGMARHRAPLEQALGVPVIEPTQAAASAAIEALRPKS